MVQVSVTGTNTEPLLYRHTAALVDHLRREVPGVQLSLHTNGIVALERSEDFHRYDRATVSVPSLDPDTCLAMTGRAAPVELAELVPECKGYLGWESVLVPTSFFRPCFGLAFIATLHSIGQ